MCPTVRCQHTLAAHNGVKFIELVGSALLRKVDIIAAGADWLLWKKKWVRTYDLAKVKLSPRGSQFNLILTDRERRKLSMPWLQLCYNRALWDLVYNGMLRSAHNGPFSSNREARSMLKLPR